MKQNVVLQIVKGIVLAYFLSALALVVLSFVMYKWDVSESVIRGGILFAYVFPALSAVWLSAGSTMNANICGGF